MYIIITILSVTCSNFNNNNMKSTAGETHHANASPSPTQGKYQHFNLCLLYFLSFVFEWFGAECFSPFGFIFSQDSSLPLYSPHFDWSVYGIDKW